MECYIEEYIYILNGGVVLVSWPWQSSYSSTQCHSLLRDQHHTATGRYSICSTWNTGIFCYLFSEEYENALVRVQIRTDIALFFCLLLNNFKQMCFLHNKTLECSVKLPPFEASLSNKTVHAKLLGWKFIHGYCEKLYHQHIIAYLYDGNTQLVICIAYY